MQIAERKVVELREKVAGITAEFALWLAESGDTRPLRKHHSQIVRLTDQLGGLAGAVSAEIDAVPLDGDDILDVGRDLQMRMLEVHRVWDFYRSKLNLRYVEWFRPYLGALDEFASACYECAAQHDQRPNVPASALKAAPLVFLSGEFSPFLHARQTPFDVEEVDDAPDTVAFLQLVNALPVPVIGLPWYQLTHLPDAVLIAHEIGHDVERSFQLTSTTRDQLRGVQAQLPDGRRDGWFAWLPEIFADLYGVLAAGPAYVSALIDLLATDPTEVAAEPAAAPWLPHPPAALRVAITTAALHRVGFRTEAASLRASWAQAYPSSPADAAAPFADDVELVVATLAQGRYPQFGARALEQVVRFTAAQQTEATTACEAVRGGSVPPTADIRCLIAAARLAFDDGPDRYYVVPPRRQKSPQQLILDRALDLIDDRPRSLPPPIGTRSLPAPNADRAAGATLLDLVTQSARTRRIRSRTAGPPDPQPTDDEEGTTR